MIFVNAFNVIQGGGVNIVLNFLRYLISIKSEMVVSLPDTPAYRDFVSENASYERMKVVWFISDRRRYLYKYFIIKFYLEKLVKAFNVHKTYSLGNIAFKSNCPQALLIQNAYAVLNEEAVWNRFSFLNRLYLKSMRRQILQNVKYADKVLVQTEAMRKAVASSANVDIMKIGVIPNVLDLSLLEKCEDDVIFDGTELRLLFLSKFYPHKNFEILSSVCNLIGDVNITITVTLDEDNPHERKILNQLTKFPGKIKNIGPVAYSELGAVYGAHHGIFLPSLLESFSSTYIEAMFFKKLIFTSDREFAKEICGNLAFYFDPYSALDIVQSLQNVMNSPEKALEKIQQYEGHLDALTSSDQLTVNSNLLNSI